MKKREEVNIFSVEIIVDSHAVLVICVRVSIYVHLVLCSFFCCFFFFRFQNMFIFPLTFLEVI